MIRAEIKSILCLSASDGDFAAYRPDDPQSFSCSLQLFIGPHNELQSRGDSFQLTLCTPQWLTDNHADDIVVSGKGLFIVFDYNYPQILKWLTTYIEHFTGTTWQDVARRLGYVTHYEFGE